MLKFVKHHMETIDGISIYPVISFLIFFLFFIGLTIFVFRMGKNHVKSMKELPFDDGNHDPENAL